MSGINVIRRATDEDMARVEAAARRFCSARNIGNPDGEDWVHLVYWYREDVRPYGRDAGPEDYQWARALCRALRVPYDARVAVSYGYVGIRTD